MSTAGTYNYHPKVAHPNKIFPQMKSTAEQPPFYLGGSQVPINLGIEGSGFGRSYKSHLDHQRQLSTQGRGIHTTSQKQHKIYLPQHFPRI